MRAHYAQNSPLVQLILLILRYFDKTDEK